MPRSAPVTVRAFAKINLDLRILGVLPDGYHDVRTVLQSVRLPTTRFTFTPTRGPFAIECDVPGMPLDARNPDLESGGAARSSCAGGARRSPAVCEVTLTKRIPAEAGSAAAAATPPPPCWRSRASGGSISTCRASAPPRRRRAVLSGGGTVLGAGRGDDIAPDRTSARLGGHQ
jgi:4-diphosphocytidyl-2-C-methyl-D-erythritol kinase